MPFAHNDGVPTYYEIEGDVPSVLDAEGIERAAFWGHSPGGMVGSGWGTTTRSGPRCWC